MPLRKSPRRTRALLAANRSNSRKSTGPRTPDGKLRSSWNAVRHGCRMQAGSHCVPFATREAEAFQVFYFTLRDAIRPTSGTAAEERALLRTAVRAWRIRCLFERLTRRLRDEDWRALATGAVPRPNFWRLRIKRPGLSVPDWTVTISVWLRWGRGPGRSRPSPVQDGTKPGQPRMHAIVSIHTAGLSRPAEAPEAEPLKPEWERTKPECDTIQSCSENMSVPGDGSSVFVAGYALADRLIGWLMGRKKQTNPECGRKQMGSKNKSVQSGRDMVCGAGNERESRTWGAESHTSNQTKPEYFRKEGAYKNVSKTLGWLVAAASFLLKRRQKEHLGLT